MFARTVTTVSSDVTGPSPSQSDGPFPPGQHWNGHCITRWYVSFDV